MVDNKAVAIEVRSLCQAGDRRAFATFEPLAHTMWDQFRSRSRLLSLALKLRDDEQARAQIGRLQDLRPDAIDDYDSLVRLLRKYGRNEDAEAFLTHRAQMAARPSPAAVARAAVAADPGVSRYVVNIGCHDGKSWADPCYELFAGGWPGLAIDAGEHPALGVNLPSADVVKLPGTFVTPDNAADLLAGHGCPQRPALVKIDIDSFDGPVLAAVLSAFAPAAIYIEVNPEIPPPVAFAVEHHPDYRHHANSGFSGCSVAYVAKIGRPHGYALADLDLSAPPLRQDALFVQGNLMPTLGLSPLDARAAFMQQPALMCSFLDLGIDSREWRSVRDTAELCSRVRDAILLAAKSRLKQDLPFHLSIDE